MSEEQNLFEAVAPPPQRVKSPAKQAKTSAEGGKTPRKSTRAKANVQADGENTARAGSDASASTPGAPTPAGSAPAMAEAAPKARTRAAQGTRAQKAVPAQATPAPQQAHASQADHSAPVPKSDDSGPVAARAPQAAIDRATMADRAPGGSAQATSAPAANAPVAGASRGENRDQNNQNVDRYRGRDRSRGTAVAQEIASEGSTGGERHEGMKQNGGGERTESKRADGERPGGEQNVGGAQSPVERSAHAERKIAGEHVARGERNHGGERRVSNDGERVGEGSDAGDGGSEGGSAAEGGSGFDTGGTGGGSKSRRRRRKRKNRAVAGAVAAVSQPDGGSVGAIGVPAEAGLNVEPVREFRQNHGQNGYGSNGNGSNGNGFSSNGQTGNVPDGSASTGDAGGRGSAVAVIGQGFQSQNGGGQNSDGQGHRSQHHGGQGFSQSGQNGAQGQGSRRNKKKKFRRAGEGESGGPSNNAPRPPRPEPGNSLQGSTSGQGQRRKRPQPGGGGGSRGPRTFVGPMDHSYREVNGNFAESPASTVQMNNGRHRSNGHRHFSEDRMPPELMHNKRPVTIPEDAPTHIYFFIEDLFFTAKIQEAAKQQGVKVAFMKPEKDVVAHLSELHDHEHPSLIVFDLNNVNAKPLTLIPKLKAKLKKGTSILGFLSHLQGDLKQKAVEAGCHTVMPRSAFSQNLPNLLRRYGVEDEHEPNFNQ